jgi:hypothetical protein
MAAESKFQPDLVFFWALKVSSIKCLYCPPDMTTATMCWGVRFETLVLYA